MNAWKTTARAPAPIIWINGFPGVGKLTIAKDLVAQIRTTKDQPVQLIDNHQLIDPVAARFPRDHVEYYPARKAERSKAFARWVLNEEEANRILVFTESQVENDLGRSVAEEYQAAAVEAKRPFIPICLVCRPAVNVERACFEDRVRSGTTKLVDAAVVKQILEQHDILTLDDEFKLDVTTISPAEAAERILRHVKKTLLR